ncbi:MAG: hypothetical protein M3174_00030, partial [Actinomycetota bacterium]|nr:hypothetical protein [Actinomycetota bacterium]
MPENMGDGVSGTEVGLEAGVVHKNVVGVCLSGTAKWPDAHARRREKFTAKVARLSLAGVFSLGHVRKEVVL